MNIPENLWRDILDMDHGWHEKGKVWFIGQRLQYIFCADVEKREIDIISKLPNVPVLGYRRYQQLIKFGSKLVCLPYINKDILIYDMMDCSVDSILIKGCEKFSEMCCTCAGIVKDKIYIVAGWNVKKIIVLNMEEKKLDIFDIECSAANEVLGTSSVICKNQMYIPVWNKEKVISFDIETHKFKAHHILGDICGCASVYQDGKNCWVIGRNYGIIKWNPNTGEFGEVKDIPLEFKVFSMDEAGGQVDWYAYNEKREHNPSSVNFFCWEGFCDKNYIYILPAFSDSVMQIDIVTMQIKLFQVQAEFQADNNKGMPVFSSWGCDSCGNLRIVSRYDYKIYNIDMGTMSGESEGWKLSEEAISWLLNDLLEKRILERKRVRLETLIFGVEKGYIKEKGAKVNNSIGMLIYNKILS